MSFSGLSASSKSSWAMTRLEIWSSIGYPKNISGFIASYTAAIPFFQTSISADLLFTTFIFLSYDVIRNSIPQLNPDIA